MQQRMNDKTIEVRQKQDAQSKAQIQKNAEKLDVLTRGYNPLANITCKMGDKACAAKHVSAIHRTGLFHPMNESQKVQSLLKLQQQYGNRFVQRVIAQHAIQTKLQIGQPGDIYEQEADRVAEQVMQMPSPQAQQEEEKEELQTKPLFEQSTPLVQRQLEEEKEEIQTLQRQVDEEEEKELQMKEIPGQTPEVTLDLEAQSNTIRGIVYPLPQSGRILDFMTMKRKNISLKGDDKYGHWWTEMNGENDESYGWWPKYPLGGGLGGLWRTLTGVEGELNGVTSFGGTSTKDPHHGDSADQEFHPKLVVPTKPDTQVKDEVRSFARAYKGEWRWTLGWGQNCRTFQKSLMSVVGLKEP
ncbi:hypothetical protein FJZ31_06465 [Candidatus Poribacteria bacterium]|nr:hypothetical protein [Candidatus Poribacteria bacterium]